MEGLLDEVASGRGVMCAILTLCAASDYRYQDDYGRMGLKSMAFGTGDMVMDMV